MRIQNVTALSFRDMKISRGVDVRIEDGKVAAVEPAVDPGGGEHEVSRRSLDEDEEVIDGTGCYLTPGLVNTHAHTAMTLLRGSAEDVRPADWFNRYIWMYEKNLTPEDVYTGTLLGAASNSSLSLFEASKEAAERIIRRDDGAPMQRYES